MADASGNEDTAIALNISSALVENVTADPDASLSIKISGVPSDATLSAGTHNLDGSWTLTAAQLAGLHVTPGSSTDSFTLTVDATTTDGSATADTIKTLTVNVTPVAEAPLLAGATSATVNEGGLVTLGVETKFDADDTLGNVTITGLTHDLSNFNGGSYTASSGTWTGTAAQFTALTFAAGHTTGTFTLSISAPNTTPSESATATKNYTLNITSAEGPQLPILGGATSATVNEGGLVTLGVSETLFDIDDTPGTVTITGLPHDLSHFSSGTYTASSGTWTGSAALFTVLTFAAGSTTGTFTLSISAPNTTPGEAATATEKYTLTVNAPPAATHLSFTAPAGIAGGPINLALGSVAGLVGSVSITVAGFASGWSLSQGTNNGDGTWTVQTSDPASLTVTTPAGFAGASAFNVTETWTNVDGSTGTAFVSDNVEAYAPRSPIFAWSGDDTLTGAGGNDLFVFAQPIGNDTIYNFNVATDKIDLTGFAGIATLGDLAGHIADDGHGDAVITLGAGETITLHGVDAASLTASDFVFNQTPIVENAGTMTVSDGAMLPLDGTIDNTGTIALNSTGDETDLQIIGDGVTLQGGGYLTLSDSHENIIFGTNSATTLTNVDNTISGAGQIGIGDGNLMLVNETHGTIDANISGGTLTLDTGHTITNDGLLEATNGGTLQIDDPVSGGGSAIIAGGMLIFDAQSNMNVTFDNGSGTPAYGELVLGHASDFSGQISGFTGTAPDTTHSDAIDLKDISFGSNITFAYDDNAGTNTGGTLTIFGSGDTVDSITFANGEYTTASFTLSSDGSGGTLITDPPTSTTPIAAATTSSSDSAATLIGGSNGNNTITGGDILIGGGPANQSLTGTGNNDSFVFTPGFGHDTITNFQPTTDVLQIDHSVFANVQALLAATQDDGHGNVVITADAHDSIMLQHVTVAQLQVHQSDFHII